MRFMIFVIDDMGNSGSPEEMVQIDAFNDKLQANGQWITAGGLAAPIHADVIDNRKNAGLSTGKSLFDGKDFYSGFWLIQADSLEIARELAFEGSNACNRRVELRPLLGNQYLNSDGMKKIPRAVASYYKQAPAIHNRSLAEMRERILEVVPSAIEVIKYGMPTFVVEGEAIAGLMCHKNHIGFYPYSGSIISLFPEIQAKYKTSRGAIQIPTEKLLLKSEVKKLIKARLDLAGLKSR